MTGSWRPLRPQPDFYAGSMLLLTDGSVMCQDRGPGIGPKKNGGTPMWYRLIPDSYGRYENGTWARLKDSPNGPEYYASAVLKDGRVFLAGGEFDNGRDVNLLAAEIYDPMWNYWKSVPTPIRYDGGAWEHIGDAPCCVLPDGRVLLGSNMDNSTAIFDPNTETWKPAGIMGTKKNRSCAEETWVLLPDGTVLSVDCYGHPHTEKYVIAQDRWVSAGCTPFDLVERTSKETGPAVLLPDGRVFAIGATCHTALYTMPEEPFPEREGMWLNGPCFRPRYRSQCLGAKDAPACLLPNGRVLCAVGPVDGIKKHYHGPTFFFEYDPDRMSLTPVCGPSNRKREPFLGRLLLLPTGQVLFTNGSRHVEIYTPDGRPQDAWRPRIVSTSTRLQRGSDHILEGMLLNGLSQAVSYGDDYSAATNYPLVRVRRVGNGRVFYFRTHDHSTMGVQTGNEVEFTTFTVPQDISLGLYDLSVIANGIASEPLRVRIVSG
jgi:hypothetical protein